MTTSDEQAGVPDEDSPRRDADVDEEEEESFPASDPPSSWAGPSENED